MAGRCEDKCAGCKAGGLREFCGSPEGVLTAVSMSCARSMLSKILSGRTHVVTCLRVDARNVLRPVVVESLMKALSLMHAWGISCIRQSGCNVSEGCISL